MKHLGTLTLQMRGNPQKSPAFRVTITTGHGDICLHPRGSLSTFHSPGCRKTHSQVQIHSNLGPFRLCHPYAVTTLGMSHVLDRSGDCDQRTSPQPPASGLGCGSPARASITKTTRCKAHSCPKMPLVHVPASRAR